MNKSTNKVTSRTGSKNTPKTVYLPISNNIYFDGTSYRVRVSKNNVKYSQNFSSKRQAMSYRKTLLSN